MHTYISLLRGINVNGQKLIKMDALRALYENLGFQNVKSYLQSGNVIFNTDQVSSEELTAAIKSAILATFGFEVPVLILTPVQLQKAIDSNPFADTTAFETASIYFTFLFSAASLDDFAIVEAKKSDTERLLLKNQLVYLYCPNGYGKTKLSNNFIESKLKLLATTRNWKTVNELHALATKN